MGGGPDATAFGLEVKAPGRVQHERDVSLHPGIGVGLNDGAPERPDADRPRAQQRRHIVGPCTGRDDRSEEHTSELQSLMRISYAVFCLKKKKKRQKITTLSDTNNTHI